VKQDSVLVYKAEVNFNQQESLLFINSIKKHTHQSL
jgi:hypothetical protein